MDTGYELLVILGLTAVTVITRSMFLVSQREPAMPDWLRRGLRFAPIAAMAAVIAPEVLMTRGELISTWQDARLFAILAATLWFFWRRTLLGTIFCGMAVLVPLKLFLGW
jgi:branched-subunit amino acid transport protein